MTTQETQTEAALAQLWGVGIATVYGLRRRKELVADGRRKRPASSYFYTHATLDAFYAAQARGLHTPPPTTAALVTGEDTLLTIAEVTAQLGVKENVIHRLIRMGDLGRIYINPKRVTRIPASEVAHYEARVDQTRAISTGTAAKLLCVSTQVMCHIAQSPDSGLELVAVPNRGNGQFFTRASFDALLKRLLHGPITLDEWQRWILEDDQPTLSVVAAGELSGISTHALRQHILAGELVAMQALSESFWRIPIRALGLLKEQRRRRTATELMKLFSVGPGLAHSWLAARTLCKRNHGLAQSLCPNYWCIEKFVQANLTLPGMSAATWLHARQHDPEPLIPAHHLRPPVWTVTSEVIDEAVDRGVLDGVWLPTPSGGTLLQVTHASVQAFIRWRDQLYCLHAQGTCR